MTRSNDTGPKPNAESAVGVGAERVAASAPTASTAAIADAADADGAAHAAALTEQKTSHAFGGLGPAEAARKRWREKRARDEAEAQANAHGARGEVALVRVTVETGRVIDKLAREAVGGNVQAARELREWLGKVEAETDTSVSTLDRRTRQAMKARLLSELAEGDSPTDPLPHRPLPDGSADARADIGAVGQWGEPESEGHPADARDSDNASA